MKTITQKKTVKLFAAILLAITVFIPVLYANYSPELKHEHSEYLYEGIPKEKAEKIIAQEYGETISDKLIENEIGIVPNGIFCLFGHDMAYGHVEQTTHKYYATNPRCLKNIKDVEYCKRSSCDYYKVTGESNSRIICCL